MNTETPASPRMATARRKLLEAALSVIRTKGYVATTVDELCAKAGVAANPARTNTGASFISVRFAMVEIAIFVASVTSPLPAVNKPGRG